VASVAASLPTPEGQCCRRVARPGQSSARARRPSASFPFAVGVALFCARSAETSLRLQTACRFAIRCLSQKSPVSKAFFRADDGARTRDPQLGNPVGFRLTVRLTPAARQAVRQSPAQGSPRRAPLPQPRGPRAGVGTPRSCRPTKTLELCLVLVEKSPARFGRPFVGTPATAGSCAASTWTRASPSRHARRAARSALQARRLRPRRAPEPAT
jgi:hypothetical protein